jgi:hypothetical protein
MAFTEREMAEIEEALGLNQPFVFPEHLVDPPILYPISNQNLTEITEEIHKP